MPALRGSAPDELLGATNLLGAQQAVVARAVTEAVTEDLCVLDAAATQGRPAGRQRIMQDLRSVKPPPGMTNSSRAVVRSFAGSHSTPS